jgi:hypothetical protein
MSTRPSRQSGKDDHILVAHGESPRAVSITLQPTSGGARFNRASNILQRGNIFMPAAEITAGRVAPSSAGMTERIQLCTFAVSW